MNENLKKKLFEYTAENAFVQACGIEIWELEEDHAVMGTAARPELLNPMGMLHGGLLFTLADCCSGVTARTDGRTYVTQTGSLNYYRNIHEGQVYAVGKVQHRGRTVCTVLVEIYARETQKLLAAGTFSMFATQN